MYFRWIGTKISSTNVYHRETVFYTVSFKVILNNFQLELQNEILFDFNNIIIIYCIINEIVSILFILHIEK